ncbi:glycosyltransferase [Bradyrhizobium sp. SZCCHNRI1073]|uniref:glycosyltransferase n=1 Tax=Bradyrhizobium sp. SZCCHNRI1073 TaxID=3057280 RepID=UPI002915E301|nr:glycosyltransferase [Bradyrhizobium sp. SZCCHNRI1073]
MKKASEIKANVELPAAILVMPCLNEQNTLARTCNTLGFGDTAVQRGKNTYLVIVDNGSSDSSLQIQDHIRQASLNNTVILGREPARGYVPPRHHGIELARALAHQRGWREEEVLILQVDADTDYEANYVDEMRKAAVACGRGKMLEGLATPPSDFANDYPSFIDLCGMADRSVEHCFVDERRDIVVDDKVSGFWLKDYFSWGAHQREYLPTGHEIFAETSRLFIKAKLTGANKKVVEKAHARPSRRKVLEDPFRYFATAGFPRGEEFKTLTVDISELRPGKSGFAVDLAFRLRCAHSALLFGLLPLHVAALLQDIVGLERQMKAFRTSLSWLSRTTLDTIATRPGLLFEKAFAILADDAQTSELLHAISTETG